MSYCRRSDDSDIYLYPHFLGYICCSGCSLAPFGGDSILIDPEQTLAHVKEHRLNGDKVPVYVDKRLRTEISQKKFPFDEKFRKISEQETEEFARIVGSDSDIPEYLHCSDCGAKIDYGNYKVIGDYVYCGDADHCSYHNNCKENHVEEEPCSKILEKNKK